MAKAFFRSVTDQIKGPSSKTTDVQLEQFISNFEEDHSKLIKLKREFDKYTRAILVFDNASHRFFEFINSLTDSTWSQKSTFVQTCIDMGRLRNEHLEQLHKDINASIDVSFKTIEKMKNRIDDENRIQHDYDKTRKQYQTTLKRDEQLKIDRIKSEVDQLKSALNLLNSELRDELPQVHLELQNQYIKIILELFDIHGKYYKNHYKLCSRSSKQIQGNNSTESNSNDIDIIENKRSSVIYTDIKVSYDKTSPKQKRTDYKILHQVRVIHDYKAENEDELDLIEDEYISVISFYIEENNQRDQGWEYGEKSDGTIGLFPVNFAVRVYENEKKDSRL